MDSATDKTDIMMMIINSLYTTAKNDLDTSMLLFKEGKYAPALFYLQQSVEKINKYWMVKSNKWNDNIRDIENFLKLLGHQLDKKILELLRQLNKVCKKCKRRGYEHIQSNNITVYNDIDVRELGEYINILIKHLDNIIKQQQITFQQLTTIFEANIDERKVNEELSQLITNSQSNRISNTLAQLFSSFPVSVLMKAMLLQMFLSKYDLVNNTRYPTSNNTCRDPYEYYNNEHELIVNYCTLHNYVSNIIDALGNNIVAGSPG